MEYLAIEDIAENLNASVRTVRRYVASGQLAAERRGAKYLVSETSYLSFCKRHTAVDAETGRRRLLENVTVQFLPGLGVNPEEKVVRKTSCQNRRPRSNWAEKASGRVWADDVTWQDISKAWGRPGHSEMTFVDLFCGAGGLSKGLEMAGLNGVCGLDWFDEAGQTYARNFEHPFVNGDIKDPANKRRFYDTVRAQLHGRRLNVVAGGFPCQGFSMAGNRIVDDPRNSLYMELVEIVDTLKPDFVICENVKGLRSMLGGGVERKILADFASIGYRMSVTVLCAADYYTPQKRERVIFIGNRVGVRNLYPKPILSPDEYVTTGAAIGDLMEREPDPAFNHVPTRHSAEMTKRMNELPEGKSLYKGYSDAWKKCPWNEASCTIKENHGGVNVHPRLPRVLTAREMARLQSFPDDFVFEGKKSKQLVQIGNAVPPLLGKAIGLAVRYSAGDIID